MLRSHTDHLIITAPSLVSGIEFVRRSLGVAPQTGGEHTLMGTHNVLLKLGDALYLEVISVNPQAANPDRPRWFELDRLDRDSPPRLATWAARTNDIEAAAAASPLTLGAIEPMSRGQLNWRVTISADGSLPLQGIAPTLIQWEGTAHPADSLKDLGCSLAKFEGFHPEADRVSSMLRAIGFQDEFSLSPLAPSIRPYLVAHIRTPTGVRSLGAPSV
jgi:hypothetical protein